MRLAIAQVAIGVTVGAGVLLMIEIWQRRGLAADIDRGVVVTADQIDAADDAVLSTALVALLCLVVALVAHVVWFHCAYKNLATWRRVERHTAWAIWGWFVPFLNLVRPFQMTREAVACSAARPSGGTGLVGVWWATWLLAALSTRLLNAIDGDTTGSFIVSEYVRLAYVALGALALVVLGVIEQRVTRDQHTRIAEPAG